jgi:asparagine synthase (glutamine-hydrolysing)
VTRHLTGIFDPGARARLPRPPEAPGAQPVTALDLAPLQLAFTGSAPASTEPLCLLAGFLDNAQALAGSLGLSPALGAEQLLAAGYRRWGRELLPRLRGDFVLLIWDRERAEGLLARDQLGVRSLFLQEHSGSLSFATEIRDLLPLLPRRPAPDPVGVAHWITMTARPGSETLYTGIRRLDPGCVLLLDRTGVRRERYWALRFSEPLDVPRAELPGHIGEALAVAVARRLDPAGTTGVLMSGGLDSSAVAAVAAAHAPDGQLAAYAAEFPDHPEVDESQAIGLLRGELRLGGATAKVRAGGLLASALTWIEAWQLPPTTWGEFWARPLMGAAAADGVRVMLSGEGGDELFGCRAYLLADRLRAGRLRDALALTRQLPGAGDRPPRKVVARAVAEFGLRGAIPHGLHDALRWGFARRRLPGWVRAPIVRELAKADERLAWKRLDGPRWWAHDAHIFTRGVEQFGVFENHRRQAALAGLESRHPLFDLDLLELGLRQPPRATFDPHLTRPLLRASMAGLLPDAVRLQPAKALFNSLLIDTLAGSDRVAIDRLLSGPGTELAAYIDVEQMRHTLLAGGPQAAPDPFRWMYQVWRLVTAECWLRMQGGSAAALAAELGASPAQVTLHTVRRPSAAAPVG